jgi:hypothetical protein
MTSTRARRIVLAVAVGILAIGAAVAANVALLGLANGPQDRVGRLQLRLDRPAAAHSSPSQPPKLVVTTPPPTRVDDEPGPDD